MVVAEVTLSTREGQEKWSAGTSRWAGWGEGRAGECWRVTCERPCGGAAHRQVLSSSSTKSPATFARGRWPT
jgi:hypothetical protein